MSNAGDNGQVNINPQAVSESIVRLKRLSFEASTTANQCSDHRSRAQNVVDKIRGLGNALQHLGHEDIWRELGVSELAGDIWRTSQWFDDALTESKGILRLLTETHPGKLVPKLENEFAPFHQRLMGLHSQAQDASESLSFRHFLDLVWSDVINVLLNSLSAGAWGLLEEIETLISVQEWLLQHELDLINLVGDRLDRFWNVRDAMHFDTTANPQKNDPQEDAFRSFDENYKADPNHPIQIGEVTGPNGEAVVVVQLLGVEGIINGRANNLVHAGLVGLGVGPDPYYSDAQTAINKYLTEHNLNVNTTQVIIEGHSMGGMEAQELAARSSFNVVGVYTYGSPNLDLSHGHAHVYQMYAHQNDIVSDLSVKDARARLIARVATRADQTLTGSSNYNAEYEHYSGITIISNDAPSVLQSIEHTGGDVHNYPSSQVVKYFSPEATGFKFSVSQITDVEHYRAPVRTP